jgi:hypothetical protein
MSSKKLPITTGAVITFILSIVLLGLSLSEIILEQNVLHTFRNVKIQYPNSSLAENLWVSLNPDYIDPNPTIAISVAGAVGVISAISSIVWVSALWWGVGWMVV